MKTIKRERYGHTEIIVQESEVPFPQAKFAMELMRHLAIAAGVPDGYDTVGRQKLRLMTEEEVVARASKIAELSWKEFRTRNWLLDIPTEPEAKND